MIESILEITYIGNKDIGFNEFDRINESFDWINQDNNNKRYYSFKRLWTRYLQLPKKNS